MDRKQRLERRVRVLLAGFIVGVVLSGATAFPLTQELNLIARWIGAESPSQPGLQGWIANVRDALVAMDARYPFLAYGYDWLAYGHLAIAAAFVGPYRNPVRNVFVIQWGMVICLATLPIVAICGPIREIPLAWRLLDCSFGLIGIVPLAFCLRDIRELERLQPLSGQVETNR